jgi:hypothetical protein
VTAARFLAIHYAGRVAGHPTIVRVQWLVAYMVSDLVADQDERNKQR